jgi:hypothetical protein
VRTDRQREADLTELIVAFRNCAKEPKMRVKPQSGGTKGQNTRSSHIADIPQTIRNTLT